MCVKMSVPALWVLALAVHFASAGEASRDAPHPIVLSGADWHIHDDPDGKGAERGLAVAHPEASGWIPASVPGNIQADLEAAHLLKPLRYGAGDLEVDSSVDLPARAVFRVRRLTPNADGKLAATDGQLGTCPTVTVDAALKKGKNLLEAKLTLDHPALWWPNGQGEQPLYELESTLIASGGDGKLETHPTDQRTTRFGVREIRWEQCPGAPADFINPLRLVVNGRPVRQMGPPGQLGLRG